MHRKNESSALKIRVIKKEYEINAKTRVDPRFGAKAPCPENDYAPADIQDIARLRAHNGMVILDPSYKCDMACRFCCLSIESTESLSWANLSLPLKMLALKGINRAIITGGEPGIFPDIEEWVRDLKSWGYKNIRLMTNGLWAINKSQIERLIDAGLTEVELSIKAFSNDSAEALTKTQNVFTKQLSAIHNINAQFKKNRIRFFTLTHVLTSQTLDDFNAIKWLDSFPAEPTVNLCIIEPYSDSDVDLIPMKEDLTKTLICKFDYFDTNGINYKVDGIPLCALGHHRSASYDNIRLKDTRLRAFSKPKNNYDYILIHYGYQRLLQYHYPEQCSICTEKKNCIGIHKRYFKKWDVSPIEPSRRISCK